MAQPDLPGYPLGSGNRISDDQRRILKDKTGFDGYLAYLEDYRKQHSGYKTLLKYWRFCETKNPETCYDCEILDLIKDENSLISLNLCCRTNSNSELFTALSEPQEGVYGRIVLCHMPEVYRFHTELLEDIGLVLDLSPTFLDFLYRKLDRKPINFAYIPAFATTYVVVGARIATMTRCCISEKSTAVPIVFIADITNPIFDPTKDGPAIQRRMDPLSPSGISRYGKIVVDLIERNSVFTKSADDLILPALLAAMYMGALYLRATCNIRSTEWYRYGQNRQLLKTMSKDRDERCQKIDDFEDVWHDALICFGSLYGDDWSQTYGFESTVKYFTQTIDRARRFEAKTRHLFHAHVGHLSLEEAEKSIELSTSQIQEGKRVKIFTVLAFVYVPLNLASSIFGMNIQQLNNSGQSIWSFLITAMVLLILTGGLWMFIEEVNGYLSWLRNYDPDLSHPPLPCPTYSIGVRVLLLVWLICNGHWTWARKTKAWWYILANSRPMSMESNPSNWSVSPGEYVSANMPYGERSNAFRVD